MSYIYEALKRAESENARVLGAPATRRRRPIFLDFSRRWWLWLLIGVLGTNAFVVTVLLVRSSRSPAATVARADHGPAPVNILRGTESAAVTPAAPPPIPAAGAVTTGTATPPVRTAAPTARPSARPVSPAPNVAGRAVAKPSVAVDPPAPASAPTAVSEARPTSPPTAAATAAVAPLAAPSTPPTSAPAPQNTSPTAVEEPRLHVQVVVYSDVPAERMVFIDGRRYAEGDKVDAETVVERITPEGAVVTRRGQRFPLTSGRP